MYYTNAKTVKDFIENLPKLITDNQNDYETYFLTITFKDTYKELPKEAYKTFFKRFYKQINQLTINNPSKHPDSVSKLILIPEPSYSMSKMFRNPHFHCVMMIKKTQLEHFNKKCVTHLKLRRCKKKRISRRPKFSLVQELSNRLIGKMNKQILRIFSTDVQKIYEPVGVSKYIGKRLFKMKRNLINYDFADIRKFQGFQRAHRDDKNLENCNITYDDILFFCRESENHK